MKTEKEIEKEFNEAVAAMPLTEEDRGTIWIYSRIKLMGWIQALDWVMDGKLTKAKRDEVIK